MRTLETLIDEARAVCHTDAELARRLGVNGNHPHEWRTGKRVLSAATVGQLCDLIGVDGIEAQRLAAEAIIASAKPEKQGVLRRAFFGLSTTGAASGAAALIGIAVYAITGLLARNAGIEWPTMYIM